MKKYKVTLITTDKALIAKLDIEANKHILYECEIIQ